MSRQVQGLVAAGMVVSRATRSMRSITLWEELDDIYGMGGVEQHVRAARVPTRCGVTTTCMVYRAAGDWREMLFPDRESALLRMGLFARKESGNAESD